MTIGPNENSNPALKAWVRALEMTAPIARNTAVTFPVLIETLADKYGTAPALLSDGECLTYGALANRSNRYARWALGQGIATGDVVCLLMLNCPDYMAIWLGITRIGGIVSLVNTNLVGDSLAHAINIVEPKHVIVGAELAESFGAVLPRLGLEIDCWAHGWGSHGFPRTTMKSSVTRTIDFKARSVRRHPPGIGRSISTRLARPAWPRPRT